jgi:hypothetical protein
MCRINVQAAVVECTSIASNRTGKKGDTGDVEIDSPYTQLWSLVSCEAWQSKADICKAY